MQVHEKIRQRQAEEQAIPVTIEEYDQTLSQRLQKALETVGRPTPTLKPGRSDANHGGSAARNQTVAEEVANSLSHGLGSIAALVVALWFLLPHARQEGTTLTFLATTVFVVTMIGLYAISSLYHALPPGRLKNLFLTLDYSAIYLFIAGTYTPFTLGVLNDTVAGSSARSSGAWRPSASS